MRMFEGSNTEERKRTPGRASRFAAAALALSLGVSDVLASGDAQKDLNPEFSGCEGGEQWSSPRDCGLDLVAWEAYERSVEYRYIHPGKADPEIIWRLLENIKVNIQAAKDVLNVRKAKPAEDATLEEWLTYRKRIKSVFKIWDEWEAGTKHPQPHQVLELIGDDGEAYRAVTKKEREKEIKDAQQKAQEVMGRIQSEK